MLSVRKRQVGGGGRGSEGEAGCSLLKRQVGKRSANEKHASRFPFWNTIANHGAQYPIMVHNIQSPALKQTRLPYIKILRICRHSRQSVVSNPSACQMVESRILYVGIRESGRMLHISFIIIFHIPFLPLIYLLMLRY